MSEKITTLTQMEMAAIRGLQAAGKVAQAAADAIEEVLDAIKADKAEVFTYLENQTDPDTLQSPGLYSIGENKYLVLRHNDERFSLFQIRITTHNTKPISFAYRHNDAGSSGYWSEWVDLGGVPDGSITAEKLADSLMASLYRYYGYASSNYSPDQIDGVGVHGGAYTGPTGWPSDYSSQAMPLILEAEVGHGIYSGSPEWDSMKTRMQVCIGPDGALSCRYKIPQASGTPDNWQWSAWSSKSGGGGIPFGTCTTESGTAVKAVNAPGFELKTGAALLVQFGNGNSASSLSLNVNGTGVKSVMCNASTSVNLPLGSADVAMFVYSGGYYFLVRTKA